MITPEEGLDRVRGAAALLVGLDFDGVLAEIVDRPELARPVEGVRQVLVDLVALPSVRVAAVSGRRRADLLERLEPPPGVIVVGEHGADPGDIDGVRPEAYGAARAALRQVADRFPGAWVEEKVTGLTIHGRELTVTDAEDMMLRAEEALTDVVPGAFDRGKRVVDVRLTGATKGAAVTSLRRPEEVVLFIGDDTTDETVFVALDDGDLGVKVGPGETAAACRLPDPSAVVRFLRQLVEQRHGVLGPGGVGATPR